VESLESHLAKTEQMLLQVSLLSGDEKAIVETCELIFLPLSSSFVLESTSPPN